MYDHATSVRLKCSHNKYPIKLKCRNNFDQLISYLRAFILDQLFETVDNVDEAIIIIVTKISYRDKGKKSRTGTGYTVGYKYTQKWKDLQNVRCLFLIYNNNM